MKAQIKALEISSEQIVNLSYAQLKTPVGVEVTAGETPSLMGQFIGETHRGLECAQAHPLKNQHQRGPI